MRKVAGTCGLHFVGRPGHFPVGTWPNDRIPKVVNALIQEIGDAPEMTILKR